VMRTKGSRLATPGRPDTWPIKTDRAPLRILPANREVSRPPVRVARPALRN